MEGREGSREEFTASGQDDAVPCICADEVATDAIGLVQAVLLLQAVSVDDAQTRMARIQPFWETLSAQSRVDLLSVPIAVARQQAAQLTAMLHRVEGLKRSSAFKQGSCAPVQLQ